MRVVFAAAPAVGHLNPMLSLARAFAESGDDVTVATAPELSARAEAAGVRAVPAGPNLDVWWAELARRAGGTPGGGLPIDRILPYFIPRLFAEIGTLQMVDDLVRCARGADLVVFETFAFAGPLAAAVAGIPAVHHLLGPPPPLEAMQLAGDAVSPLWRKWQLEPRPYAGVYAGITLTICPAALGTTDLPVDVEVRQLKPVVLDAVAGETVPPWLRELADRPNVYMTLGTVTNTDRSVFAAVLDGLSGEPINVIITVGPENDPGELGRLPDNAHAERYIPQSLLLPSCSAVISHAGSGTMLATLRAGLPHLMIPQGADQYINATICVRAGVAARLLPDEVTAANIRDRVRAMLRGGPMQQKAALVRDEIKAMPEPASTAAWLRQRVRASSN